MRAYQTAKPPKEIRKREPRGIRRTTLSTYTPALAIILPHIRGQSLQTPCKSIGKLFPVLLGHSLSRCSWLIGPAFPFQAVLFSEALSMQGILFPLSVSPLVFSQALPISLARSSVFWIEPRGCRKTACHACHNSPEALDNTTRS